MLVSMLQVPKSVHIMDFSLELSVCSIQGCAEHQECLFCLEQRRTHEHSGPAIMLQRQTFEVMDSQHHCRLEKYKSMQVTHANTSKV